MKENFFYIFFLGKRLIYFFNLIIRIDIVSLDGVDLLKGAVDRIF